MKDLPMPESMDGYRFLKKGEYIQKEYEFIGDQKIRCECMSNGRKCNQRNLELVVEYPFFMPEGGLANLCNRMWIEKK